MKSDRRMFMSRFNPSTENELTKCENVCLDHIHRGLMILLQNIGDIDGRMTSDKILSI